MAKSKIQTIKDYLNWRMKSVNEHGLHSPFMYKLATECFYDKTHYTDYNELKKFHHTLKKDSTIIKVDNLGAGSKYFRSNQRKISQISKISGSSYKEMKFLYRLSRYFKPGNVLELGTNLGKSAFSLHLGYPRANFTSIEGDFEIYKIAQKYLSKTPIHLVHSDFKEYILQLPKNKKFDLIYLDGNHTKEATLEYFDLLLPHLHNNSVFLIDDIYWSQEMKDAWKILLQNPQVRQSIDTYHIGFLFFRKEQFQQHFTIRAF
jgi:predicted O-methyltransferase YrrM